MAADIRIADILSSEYSDFLEFCLNADKRYRSELSGADFVAFRSQYGVTREQIAELRKLIEFHESVRDSADLIDGGDSAVTTPNDIEGKSDEADSCDVSLHDTMDMPVVDGAVKVDLVELHDKDMTTEATPLAQARAVDEPQPDTEKGNTSQTNCLSYKSEMPLYQFFGVNWERYINNPILESDVGVRASNSLRVGQKKDGSIVSCKSIGDLLQLSPLQLSNYRNMGRLSIDRIFAALNQILHSDNETDEAELTNTSTPVSVDCKKQILAMLRGEEYDISNLNDSETAAFSEYAYASEAIGNEMALDAANGRRDIKEVMQMLYDFYKEPLELYGLKTALEKNVSFLPTEIKKLHVKPFIFAYHLSAAMEKNELEFPIEPSSTVLDFIHLVLDTTEDAATVLNNAISFVKWLHFDTATLCKPMRDCLEKQRENAQIAFVQRLQGETLEAIGVTMGVSRERVRQLEKKVANNIAAAYHAQCKKHDILSIIYALRGGDTVLRYDEIALYIDEVDVRMIWYLAKRGHIDCDAYHYSTQANAIVFGKETEHIDLVGLIDELPAFIKKSEMPNYIADLLDKYELNEELVRMQIKSAYKCTGMFYHRSRLTVVFMCDYILRIRFPNGYKIADESDQKRFMAYLSEIFEIKYRMTARALDAKLSELGVLIDRGKYIHPSYINVDKGIIDDVNSYIENSSRVVLTYTELFDTFAECFLGTQINNRYCLQGVLKLYGCPFVMRKDYITKESDINIDAEFERYVEHSGKVHKSVLLEEFNGLSEINIGFFCQRLPNIVVLDAGYYMHASQLDISEDDYKKQRKFLLMVCNDTPASSRMLYNEYMLRFTDFMIRNSVESYGYLFGVLQYMFREEFFFSRPYISLSNDHDLTHHGVLLQHLSEMDSIDIADLSDICDKNGIHYLSLRSLAESIEPDFIRINETTLMRKDLTGLDDDIVFDTTQQIIEIVHAHGGYCASKNIDDFSWFPELDVPWNAYLLESVAALAGDLLTVFRINTNTIYTPVAVFIGDEYISEDMNSLILRLLIKESQIEPFVSRESILTWLQKQGLCNVNLPAFLETEGHLLYDENGRLKVQ